jgi:phosphatidylserine/phosphatidylglycerophosphate/cardiolipin synthase-like enzyme
MTRIVLAILVLLLVSCSAPTPVAPALAQPMPSGSVRLWQDAAIFELVTNAISGAHTRVLVEMYELGRADIVKLLGNRRGNGLDVRVITDPTVNQSRRSAARLDRLGVPERGYPVDDAIHQIDHVKLLIADDVAVVGGMNWGVSSHRNHDFVLETHDRSELSRLTAIFEQDWSRAGGQPAPLRPWSGPIAQTSPGVEIRTMLDHAFEQVKHRVFAEVYTLTDPDVLAQFAAAHRRGADVRVLLDPNQSFNRQSYALLRSAGVEVRWYPIPKGALLHAKAGLFDGELVLGSANWTRSGLGVNHELDIETDDAKAVAAFDRTFAADWARSA